MIKLGKTAPLKPISEIWKSTKATSQTEECLRMKNDTLVRTVEVSSILAWGCFYPSLQILLSRWDKPQNPVALMVEGYDSIWSRALKNLAFPGIIGNSSNFKWTEKTRHSARLRLWFSLGQMRIGKLARNWIWRCEKWDNDRKLWQAVGASKEERLERARATQITTGRLYVLKDIKEKKRAHLKATWLLNALLYLNTSIHQQKVEVLPARDVWTQLVTTVNYPWLYTDSRVSSR